ncbi:MAG: ATP-binding cassette domain-containing protein [Bacilli bacterium]|nr:ATP-binding cassette domain-containing protein [Bacilli bacterium]MDD4077505.1 ABC-F family ATP-binding cassette domain-containing protein [Bacilli bacterium]MDD4388867.1 ABC-F family ATP-binding cassette domain-containing protein [Bacilli bacterium]
MSVLDIRNLQFGYTDKNLFNGLDLRLFHNDHLGLIGANGVGKTTLLNLIAHRLAPDGGHVEWNPGITYSYLDQYLKLHDKLTMKDYLYRVFEPLFGLEQKMNDLYLMLETVPVSRYDKILEQAYRIQTELEKNGFYLIKSKIANVIGGLGIYYEENRLLGNLSGGQKVRVYLAKMLLEEKDVLLLDEPTNFLDTPHIEWLIKLLQGYKSAFIVTSHNTDFLNRICNRIAEIENKKVTVYKGDYQSYIRQKSLTDEQYLAAYEAQQKLIKHNEEFIAKNIVRAKTSKRAQSRRKMLDKLQVLEKPPAERKIKILFPFSRPFRDFALVVKKLSIGYLHPLLSPLSFKVGFGDKIVITGKSGVGKTTFIKTVLGFITPLNGTVLLNSLNNILYFAQEYSGNLNCSAIDFIQNDYPLLPNNEIRDILAVYGIRGDLTLKPLRQLSGGELTKVRFAKLGMTAANILILDEPTNHLDKTAKAALFSAIAEFPGTVILVTHEKSFYSKLNMKEISFN